MSKVNFDDPMDWVGHYWQEQNMGDPRQFVAMGSLLRLHQMMTAEIEKVLKSSELTLTSYLVLATIQLCADGTRLLSRIASHMLVHPTTVTLVIDKLEGQGLVAREPHPTDRRATYARITPAGRALMKEASRALGEIDFGMRGLSPKQAGDLSKMLAPIRTAGGDIDRTHS